jgi:hypothetical protein
MSWQATRYVLEHSRAKYSARLVLLALAERARGPNSQHPWEAWPSVTTLAHETGLCERTVQSALRKLVELDEIETVLHGAPVRGQIIYRPNSYRIIVPDSGAISAPPVVQDSTPSGAESGTSVVQDSTPSGAKCGTPVVQDSRTSGQLNGTEPRTERPEQPTIEPSSKPPTTERDERFDTVIAVIAQKRSLQPWVTSPKAVKNATLKKLSDPNNANAKALRVWLDGHPVMSDDDVADVYLRDEIPDTEGYPPTHDINNNDQAFDWAPKCGVEKCHWFSKEREDGKCACDQEPATCIGLHIDS